MARSSSPITHNIFSQKSGEFQALAAFGRCADSENVARGEEFMQALQSLVESESKIHLQGNHKANGTPLLCGKYSASKV